MLPVYLATKRLYKQSRTEQSEQRMLRRRDGCHAYGCRSVDCWSWRRSVLSQCFDSLTEQCFQNSIYSRMLFQATAALCNTVALDKAQFSSFWLQLKASPFSFTLYQLWYLCGCANTREPPSRVPVHRRLSVYLNVTV